MRSHLRNILILALVLLISVSCNLPGNLINQATSVNTPNATLTALFDMSQRIPATLTPVDILPVNTDEPVVIEITATPEGILDQTQLPASTITDNLIATSTSTILPTNTVVLLRDNPQVTAKYLKTAPVQDGTYAEWIDFTKKYTVTNKVWGASNWKDYSDLEAAYALGWDNSYLYFSIKVTDEQYTQKYSGVDIYNGDEVEILIDTSLLNDFYSTTLDWDDYQLGLSAGNPSQEVSKSAYLWYPKNIQGSRSDVLLSYQFEDKPIYRIEAAIPWAMLGITPYPGLRLGFAVNVNDNDNVSTYKEQTMISTGASLSVFNPTTWGELILLK